MEKTHEFAWYDKSLKAWVPSAKLLSIFPRISTSADFPYISPVFVQAEYPKVATYKKEYFIIIVDFTYPKEFLVALGTPYMFCPTAYEPEQHKELYGWASDTIEEETETSICYSNGMNPIFPRTNERVVGFAKKLSDTYQSKLRVK